MMYKIITIHTRKLEFALELFYSKEARYTSTQNYIGRGLFVDWKKTEEQKTGLQPKTMAKWV